MSSLEWSMLGIYQFSLREFPITPARFATSVLPKCSDVGDLLSICIDSLRNMTICELGITYFTLEIAQDALSFVKHCNAIV